MEIREPFLFERAHMTQIKKGKKTAVRVVTYDNDIPLTSEGGEVLAVQKVYAGGGTRLKWEVGAVYEARPQTGKGGGSVRLVRLRKQRLSDMDEEDAAREGFSSLAQFRAMWDRVHRAIPIYRVEADPIVWAIEFEWLAE